MKIGIVTYYNVPSYGAQLQAFALQSVLSQLGHDSQLIDIDYFRLQSKESVLRRFFAFSISGTLRKWKVWYQDEWLRKGSFVNKRLKQTERVYSRFDDLSDLPLDMDCCVVGSDQIWSPRLFLGQREKEKLRTVLLMFARSGVRRIAYAASFGAPTWTRADLWEELGSGIRTFDAIGVREHSGVDIVVGCGSAKPTWVLDPTLLHPDSFYQSEFGIARKRGERYLFEYVLAPSERTMNFVRRSASIRKLSKTRNQWSKGRRFGWFSMPASVEAWLAAIADSELVVTDSYHAVVFSIVFHRPFYALMQTGNSLPRNDRVLSLLSRLGLESRIRNSEQPGELENDDIDWVRIDRRLSEWRLESFDFLKMALRV